MNKVQEQILRNQRQILQNQFDIMFWITKDGNPYEGYFGKRLEETKELLGEE